MIEAVIQRLVNDMNKGFKISIKSFENKYYIYIGSYTYAVMNEIEFNKFYPKWNIAKSLMKGVN